MNDQEIPEAIREDIDPPKKSSSALLPIVIGIIILVAGGLSAFFWFRNFKSAKKTVTQPDAKPMVSQPDKSKSIEPGAINGVATQKPKSSGDLLGHLPYDVVPESELEAITADGSIKLRPAAAAKFKQMQADAQAEGINLVAVSGFRTIEDQSQLFFGVKEQKVQGAAQRAEVSAPPGYSEHHTGYAVDIGDANAPATHVEPEFADTAAFAWLQKNAAKYSFELSFPPNNEQGVSYEPWHWRFVGDRNSLETFY